MPEPREPRESLPRLFARFLRFGTLAWGGPIAQIGMIREELVERERWIGRERFNRVLAVYQALPGPEAHELCVFFGHLAGGRAGGLLAGLGFMLPGFALMLLISWAYVEHGFGTAALAGALAGLQAGAIALLLRGLHRVGAHALRTPWLWGIAGAAFVAEAAGVHFAATIVWAGAAHAALRSRARAAAVPLALAAGAAAAVWLRVDEPTAVVAASHPGFAAGAAPWSALVWTGLLAGLLSFGGAYTSIPIVREQSVGPAGWLIPAQFLDGVAISGVLPAPLIIFTTFVGYLGRGPAGAVVVTALVFAPAFGFTLLGFRRLERLVDEPRLHATLDGVAAGVVGLVAATALALLPAAVPSVALALAAAGALTALYLWGAPAAVPVAMAACAVAGLLLSRVAPA